MRAQRFAALAGSLLILAVSGCAETSKSEQEADRNCPSASAFAEGKCENTQSEHQAEHEEQVKKEQGEVESALKRKQAEEAANALGE